MMPQGKDAWDAWSESVVSEVDDATWLVDPKRATARALATGGQQLAEQAGQVAAERAFSIGQLVSVATRLDEEFTRAYPSLMETDLGRSAVGLAIKKCMGHPRFPEALQTPGKRGKIFGLIARLANEELGRTTPAASHRPSDQMADDLIRTPPERQRAAMQELVDLALGTNRTGGGL